MNGVPGYVVTLAEDPRSGEKIYVHMAWAAFDRFTLRLAAYGRESQQATLRASARSFRPLSEADRAAVEWIELRIASTLAGESLTDFSSRVGNTLSEPLTRAINDVEQDPPAAQRLKFVSARPYFEEAAAGARSDALGTGR